MRLELTVLSIEKIEIFVWRRCAIARLYLSTEYARSVGLQNVEHIILVLFLRLSHKDKFSTSLKTHLMRPE